MNMVLNGGFKGHYEGILLCKDLKLRQIISIISCLRLLKMPETFSLNVKTPQKEA